MEKFEKPVYGLEKLEETSNFGQFSMAPLEKGFGTTIGNAMRRTLLSSLPGAAIIAVKIDGVMHEYQTMDGVVEDVPTIILNLKNLVIEYTTVPGEDSKVFEEKEQKLIKLRVNKEGVVKASDIELDPELQIINPDLEIATIAKGGKIDMEMLVMYNRGYVTSNDNKKYIEDLKIGYIPIDSSFSPIERFSYEVQPCRKGQDATYEKLVMNIHTNGSIKPYVALAAGSKIFLEYLNIFSDLDGMCDFTGIMSAKQEDSKLKKLETPIEELDFSVRAFNCLKRANVNNLGDLVEKSEYEMMKIRNLGKKSLKEVIDRVKDMGLKFREED